MYRIGMQRNAKANFCSTQAQRNEVNGIERKQNGNLFMTANVFNKDLILEQSGFSGYS